MQYCLAADKDGAIVTWVERFRISGCVLNNFDFTAVRSVSDSPVTQLEFHTSSPPTKTFALPQQPLPSNRN